MLSPKRKNPPKFHVTQILDFAGRLLLDHDLAGPEATAALALAAESRASSLSPLDPAGLAADFLPALMPEAWRRRGEGCVAGARDPDAEGGAADQAPRVNWEWLQALWQWLSTPTRRSDWRVLAASGWPLLPAAGGLLVPLAPEAARCRAVLPGADWPQGLADVLARLGIAVLDTAAYELPNEALLAAGYVRAGSGLGIALALRAALDGGQLNTAPVEALSADDRRLLRAYLLQPVWFQSQRGSGASAGAQPDDCAVLASVLRQLPLYEQANSGAVGAVAASPFARSASGASDGGAAAGDDAAPVFVPLQEGWMLAPQGVLWSALDERFINGGPPGSALAATLSQHLAVPAPGAPEVYRSCVLPRLGTLAPALRDAAVATLLAALPLLEAADPSFVRGLRGSAFVPNGAGELLPPSELHDPRVPELLALLEPDSAFPSPELALDGGALAALQRLGLRVTAGGAAWGVEGTGFANCLLVEVCCAPNGCLPACAFPTPRPPRVSAHTMHPRTRPPPLQTCLPLSLRHASSRRPRQSLAAPMRRWHAAGWVFWELSRSAVAQRCSFEQKKHAPCCTRTCHPPIQAHVRFHQPS
jgi:hypothetical protein